MEAIQQMTTLKWVCIIFFIMLRSPLSSSNRVLTQKDKATYAQDSLGFGLGWSWGGIPSFGIGPGGGNIAFGGDEDDSGSGGGGATTGFSFGGRGASTDARGYDNPGFSIGGGFGGDGNPGFGFHFGGGSGGGSRGYYGGSRRPKGCHCDCERTGRNGNVRRPSTKKPYIQPYTCTPMNCPNDGNCGGFSRRADGSSPYWCNVPGSGILPYWCSSRGELPGKRLNCVPINCPKGDGCEAVGGHFVQDIPIWSNIQSSQKKGADGSKEAYKSDAQEPGHN